ncbi:hypothetical protein D3C74_50100 [compost metagenome]
MKNDHDVIAMDYSQVELKLLAKGHPKMSADLGSVDISVRRASMPKGRQRMSRNKRIRKKWLKRYGETTNYKGCTIIGYMEDNPYMMGYHWSINNSLTVGYCPICANKEREE